MALADRLRDRIRRDGALPFRDWMEACLYDPRQGYYMRPGRKTGPGTDADFATSPTLHPFFGTAIAKELVGYWEDHGRPDPFPVVEFGGGEGDLARVALQHLDATGADLADAVTWTHVETSPEHQAAQQSDDPRIGQAPEMPSIEGGAVVAHEFLDAVPFRWLQWDDGWRELHVGLDGEAFALRCGAIVEPAPALLPDLEPEPGQRIVIMPAARQWLQDVARQMHGGNILIIDYGDDGRWLWTPDRPDGTVRGFRAHQLVDVLEHPGETDITASIDFTLLQQWGHDAGLSVAGYEGQGQFLQRNGALEHLAAARKDTVADLSAYLRLKQLVLPTGVGEAFRFLRLQSRT